jgi:hypothetical protein
MKTSESIDKLAPALLAAQKEIGNASKDSKNPHFKSSYASLGSVIEAVKDAANRHGIVIVQTVSSGTDGVCLTTRLIHSSGQFIEDTAYSPLSKPDAPGVGSTVTYLRRYSAAAIFFITQEDDDGVAAMPAKPAPAPAKAQPKVDSTKPANDDPF